jgi:YhcH/YjgK/YiaL family protein
MIVDRLGNRSVDPHLPPRVRQALEYLRTADLTSLAVGRHDVEGDRIFALVQEFLTRPPDQCVWEAHRKYIDVQYVVKGVERMGHAPLSAASEREPYDLGRDVALYQPGSAFVTVKAGSYAIFGPGDVHAPGGAADHPANVRKVVVKAAIED